MSKKTALFFILCIGLISSLKASVNDTITVRSHNATHLNWYGNFDNYAVFPSDTNHYRRLWLNYMLGCPSGGCSQWDYTVQMFIRHRTGAIDSNLVATPTFTVNSANVDTFYYNTSANYSYFFNSTNNTTDSTINTAVQVYIFGDTLNPTTATDSMQVFTSNYYNHIYNATGTIIDSVLVMADSTLILAFNHHYNKYPHVDDIEFARYITPYAGGNNATWFKTFRYDITDFAHLLHDSVEIRVQYQGWSDGFTATLDFQFITGTAPQICYKMDNIYNGWMPYGDVNNPIENYLPAKTVNIEANAIATKVLTYQTGHGFGGNQDCAEFCPKHNYLKVNGTQTASNYIWRDKCGMNAYYPQNGTWLYDRANWCPGETVKVFVNDISSNVTAGTPASVNLDMDPFTNNGNNNCGYTVSTHVAYYGAINFANDVELDDIISPSQKWNYNRYNPICGQPKISIRNNGSAALTTLKIEYGIAGQAVQTYNWTGNLLFNQITEVTLPSLNVSTVAGGTKFNVLLKNPNGVADQYNFDNTGTSTIAVPPVYTQGLVVKFKPNAVPAENSYKIYDSEGNIAFSKSGFATNNTYRDTLHLPNGCYEFVLSDDGKDGFSWWANSAAGNGILTFNKVDVPNGSYKNFSGDFGTELRWPFILDGTQSIKDLENNATVNIIPNPNNGLFYLDFEGWQNVYANVDIFNITGSIVRSIKHNVGEGDAINIQDLAKGIYIVKIASEKNIVTHKIVVE